MSDTAALRKLLDAGLDPNTRSPDVNRETLLWRAVRFKALDSARLLLDRGARVDEQSITFRKTALFQAVYDGSFDIATLLLDRGADPNALDLCDTSSADKHIPVGTKDQDVMLELAPDHYTIVNTLGLSERYIRLE